MEHTLSQSERGIGQRQRTQVTQITDRLEECSKLMHRIDPMAERIGRRRFRDDLSRWRRVVERANFVP